MTTSQTIDGVPRGIVERITNPFGDPHDKFNAVQELRALLDAPAEPKPTGLSQGWNLTRKHDGFVVGHQSVAYPPDEKAIERAERDGYVWVPFLVPATQPQGEPVAYRYKEGHASWENENPWVPTTLGHGEVLIGRKELAANGTFKGEERDQHLALVVEPLYTRQPAPVAVVMPVRLTRDYGESNQVIYAGGWNACLDELKRLNSYPVVRMCDCNQGRMPCNGECKP